MEHVIFSSPQEFHQGACAGLLLVFTNVYVKPVILSFLLSASITLGPEEGGL